VEKKHMSPSWKIGGVLAAILATGTAANAATLLATDVQLAGPGGYYTVDINGQEVYDDALVLTIDGHQVLANCDDIYHEIYLGSHDSFTVAPFSGQASATNFDGGAYDTAQIDALSDLLAQSATVWKTGGPEEQLDLAALQLAAWEIGNPSATFTSYNTDVYNLAQTYITAADGQTSPAVGVVQLVGQNGVQSQLIDPSITPVPEPATWATMLIGLGLTGAALRRRTAKVWAQATVAV
jgi:hypothetical protein